MGSSWRSPPTTHRRASNTKRKFRNFPKYSTQAGAAQTQASPLCEPPRRLQWLRQELDLWNDAAGDRPMPQPQDALVVRPEAGRALCEQAILNYVDPNDAEDYGLKLAEMRDELRVEVQRLLEAR